MPLLSAANRQTRAALRAKGYVVDYAEFGGGHTFLCWQGTLSAGLLALLNAEPTILREA